MVRVRLLIYKGNEKWINNTIAHDKIKNDEVINFGSDNSIESQELEPKLLKDSLRAIKAINTIMEIFE